MKNEEFVRIGQIINTHGLKGTVKVYPYTDNIKRFSLLNSVFLGEEHKILIIEHVCYRKDLVYLDFKDLNSIDSVLSLKEKYLYILKEDRMPLSEDSFYIDDILHFSIEDELGEKLGILIDVLQGNGNDVFVVENDGKKYMIPVVKQFIKKIDMKNHVVQISPIEGMIE